MICTRVPGSDAWFPPGRHSFDLVTGTAVALAPRDALPGGSHASRTRDSRVGGGPGDCRASVDGGARDGATGTAEDVRPATGRRLGPAGRAAAAERAAVRRAGRAGAGPARDLPRPSPLKPGRRGVSRTVAAPGRRRASFRRATTDRGRTTSRRSAWTAASTTTRISASTTGRTTGRSIPIRGRSSGPRATAPARCVPRSSRSRPRSGSTGTTPAVVDDFDGIFQRLYLPAGQHEIEFYLEGYEPYHQKLYLGPGDTTEITHQMQALRAGEALPPPDAPSALPEDWMGGAPSAVGDRPASPFGVLALRIEPADAQIRRRRRCLAGDGRTDGAGYPRAGRLASARGSPRRLSDLPNRDRAVRRGDHATERAAGALRPIVAREC